MVHTCKYKSGRNIGNKVISDVNCVWMHDRITKLSLQEMCGNISNVKSHCSGIRKKNTKSNNRYIRLHRVLLISRLRTKIPCQLHSRSTGCSLFGNNSGKRLSSLRENNRYPRSTHFMQIRSVFQ